MDHHKSFGLDFVKRWLIPTSPFKVIVVEMMDAKINHQTQLIQPNKISSLFLMKIIILMKILCNLVLNGRNGMNISSNQQKINLYKHVMSFVWTCSSRPNGNQVEKTMIQETDLQVLMIHHLHKFQVTRIIIGMLGITSGMEHQEVHLMMVITGEIVPTFSYSTTKGLIIFQVNLLGLIPPIITSKGACVYLLAKIGELVLIYKKDAHQNTSQVKS